MLTKEECSKCLNDLYLASSKARMFITDREYCYDVLSQLVKEHFDNPPLKLEELKKGMWIWDNKDKDYIKLRYNCSSIGPLYWSCEIVGEGYVHTIEFEEGRYFRKQVE